MNEKVATAERRPIKVSAADVDLLDGLAKICTNEVVNAHQHGNYDTQADDETSDTIFKLSSKVADKCSDPQGKLLEGEFDLFCTDEQESLIWDARRQAGAIPQQREAS